jgi:hypothetical protein
MKSFRTLKGFMEGHESNESTFFAQSATLRILGTSLDFDAISKNLQLQPTRAHRKGEKRGPRSPAFAEDMWSFSPTLAESRPLAEHIDALWDSIKHAEVFLRELKRVARVDVFLGYRSNHDHAGIEVPHTSLQMFTRLEIPFGISIIVA